MSIASGIFPRNDPAVAPAKKKRVLLVDTSRAKRDLRSETMRRLGIEVDCAADICEARCWWRADLYDLVLIHVENTPGAVDKFCTDLRSATPRQQIMFLLGGPPYLSSVPETERAPQDEAEDSALFEDNNAAAVMSNSTNREPQRWGIMEACRRISAIRSVCDARAKAVRDRPEPRRDSETSRPSGKDDAATVEFVRKEPL